MRRATTSTILVIFLGSAAISCSGGIVSVGDRDGGAGNAGAGGSAETGGSNATTGSGGNTGTGGSSMTTGSGGTVNGSGGSSSTGSGGATSGAGGSGGTVDAGCLGPVPCPSGLHWDPDHCLCVYNARDAGCVSAQGEPCGGNIADPCTCADGLVCTARTDSGVIADVGGICEPASDAGNGILHCGATQHVCACANGAYCLAGNALCIAPTSPCPAGISLACPTTEHVCQCSIGAQCAPLGAACTSPSSPCP